MDVCQIREQVVFLFYYLKILYLQSLPSVSLLALAYGMAYRKVTNCAVKLSSIDSSTSVGQQMEKQIDFLEAEGISDLPHISSLEMIITPCWPLLFKDIFMKQDEREGLSASGMGHSLAHVIIKGFSEYPEK